MCDWIFKQISKLFPKNNHSTSYELRDTTSEDEAANILDYLSPELLELIFIHLDVNSLKSCLEVSKIFKDTIIHSAVIMRRIPMTINDENWNSNLQFIQNYGKYVRNVEVERGKDYLIIYRLLDLMPNIQKVKILHGRYSSESKEYNEQLKGLNEIENINFKIKTLEFKHSSFFKTDLFTKFLNTTSLTKFCFDNIVDYEFVVDTLVPFICQQNSLTHMEIRLNKIDALFSKNSIAKMNFRLRIFKIDQNLMQPKDFTNLNQFLFKQSKSLEELRVCLCDYSNNEIMKLQNLKKLTTYSLLSYFKHDNEAKKKTLMPNLKFLQFYKAFGFDDFQVIDTTCLPNLEVVKFSQLNRMLEPSLGIRQTINLLQNLEYLKHFRCEFQGVECLKFLKSQKLESLEISFYFELFQTDKWTQIAENLPNLQKLVLTHIENEEFCKFDFLDFIIENVEDLLDLSGNKSLKVLKLHSSQDDLEMILENRKVVKCIGYSCEMFSPLYCDQKLIIRKYKILSFTLLTKREFYEKFNGFY